MSSLRKEQNLLFQKENKLRHSKSMKLLFHIVQINEYPKYIYFRVIYVLF